MTYKSYLYETLTNTTNMEERYTFPASHSNEITKEYYFFVKGMMNRGVTNLKVSEKRTRRKTTYHLITTR